MLKRLNKKFIFVILCVITIVLITSIVSIAVRKTPTEPVRSIIIESDTFDNEGSFKIEESAKWTSNNTAKISFDLSTVPQLDGRNKDVVFVLDTSTPYINTDINVEKNTIKSLIDYILANDNNKVALITYNSTSEILTNFTNDKNELKNNIDEISASGNSSYTAALLNIETLLENYQKNDNRDLNVVFFTYRYPNADDNNRIAIYEKLKLKFPYININGVQLRLDLHQPLIDITDKQLLANENTLYNYLLEAALDTLKYEKFELLYYIDNNYFTVNENDINTSIGTINLKEEDGKQIIVWNIDNDIITGEYGSMTVNLNLKNEYIDVSGLYPTNDRVNIKAKVIDKNLQVKESDRTPVLKNNYTVSYDTNAPSGCNLNTINSESHAIYSNVTKNQTNLTCSGYTFKGWKTETEIVNINDDTFIMPEEDVTLKAIWSKPSISKSMTGTIHEKSTLYKKVKNDYLNDNSGNLYTGEGANDYLNDVYYYSKGDNELNTNVLIGSTCFRMIRTTETGGVKLIYNGKSLNGTCGQNNIIQEGLTGYSIQSLASNYYYGTSYTYDSDNNTFKLSGSITHGTWNDTNYQNYLSKYTCLSDNEQDTCQTLYYVDEYNSSSSAKCFEFGENNDYNTIGNITGVPDDSLAYLGYMYNDVYKSNYELISTNILDMLLSTDINSNYYYGDSITNNTLDNPFTVTNNEYNNIIGKYTYFNEDNSYESEYPYYIVGVDNNKIYYLNAFNNTNPRYDDNTYKFGDSITDNGNGTYTISGNIVTTKLTDWLNDYSSVVDKYTCNSDNLTCTSPYYVTKTNQNSFEYYSLDKNYKYGNSFSYDTNTNMYTLTNTVSFYDLYDNYTELGNHHYTCFNTSGTCSEISYIYEFDDNSKNIYYINISNGKSITDAIDEMLSSNSVNNKSSIYKKAIDLWYEKNIIEYSDYLEDTVFCNDRSISSFGSWDKDSNIIKYDNTNDTGNLQFNKYNMLNNNTISLNCPANDKFSVSNIGNGALTYPVGLLTIEEAKMTKGLLTSSGDTLLMSPSYYLKNKAYGLKESNDTISVTSYTSGSLRPVISIKSNIEFLYGYGTNDHPYVIAE